MKTVHDRFQWLYALGISPIDAVFKSMLHKKYEMYGGNNRELAHWIPAHYGVNTFH